MRAGWIFAGGMLLALPGLAQADIVPDCPPPPGAQFHAFADIPTGLKQALDSDVGAMALPGRPFNAGDVIVCPLSRRGIFVWNRGARWIVATEHGGRAYSDPILAYDLSPDGATATLVGETDTRPNAVCTTATALLDAH